MFVAMSFDDRFQFRWEKVIAPGVAKVARDNKPLAAYRVDARRVGDSILTEILGGISNSLLVLADVTTITHADSKPVRNGNVMYEVGIAHAVRLPEEVLIFRSDADSLLFDVSNVRVNSYDPDKNPDEASRKVAEAVFEAVREVDLKRHLAVKAAAHALDFTAWWVLVTAAQKTAIHTFPTRSIAQSLGNGPSNAAIIRLLQIGALKTDYGSVAIDKIDQEDAARELLAYSPTAFGMAVLQCAAERMFEEMSPDVRAVFESEFKEAQRSTHTPG